MGAAVGHPGAVNLGDASHITAASPGGKRFDPALSSQERSAYANGIWLCGVCAKLIDRDEQAFTVELLRDLKSRAEAASAEAIGYRSEQYQRLLRADLGLTETSPEREPLPPQAGARLRLRSKMKSVDPEVRDRSVGDVVRWGRLLDGAYAQRPALMVSAIGEYLTWLTTIEAVRSERRLPAFWIDGRSGDGKSVLLLQLAAEILGGNSGTLIYQATRGDSLPAIIAHVRQGQGGQHLALVLVEDLHKIADQASFSATLQLQLDQDLAPVAILACGPTPERQSFELRNPLLAISTWSIPSVSPDDIAIFERWFGVDVPALTNFKNTILVELLFVSKIGQPLSTFAVSFGDRLQSLGVFNTTVSMVAANALDLSFPTYHLGGREVSDTLERLASDDQLHFERVAEIWGEGIRLVHSAIAWRLFQSWSFDPKRLVLLPRRLARALADMMRAPQVLDGFVDSLLDRVEERLGSLLEDADQPDDCTLDEMWSLLIGELHDASDAQSFVLAHALVATSPSEQLSRLAHQLARDETLRIERRALLATRLAIKSVQGPEADEYIRFAERLCNEVPCERGAAAIVFELLRARLGSRTFAESWLERQPLTSLGAPLLCLTMTRFGSAPSIVSIVHRWLDHHAESENAAAPLTMLLRLAPDETTGKRALAWVQMHSRTRGAGDILCALLRKGKVNQTYVDVAESWLQNNYDLPVALNVGSVLLNAPSAKVRARIAPTIHRLMASNSKAAELQNILPVALRKYGGEAWVKHLALQWLEFNPDASMGGSIAAALVTPGSSRETTSVIWSWIARNIDKPSGATTLSSFINARYKDPGIDALCHEIILRHMDNPAIFNPLSTLLRHFGDNEKHRLLALAWLNRNGDSPGTHSVFCSLLRADPQDATIATSAIAWARAHLPNLLTGQLLSSLLHSRLDFPIVRALALEWLTFHPDTLEAAQLITALVAETSGETQIEKLAETWIQGNAHRVAQRDQLVAALITASPAVQKWVDRAIDLMDDCPASRDTSFLTYALVTARPYDAAVSARAKLFLTNRNVFPKGVEIVLRQWLDVGGPECQAVPCIIDICEDISRGGGHSDQLYAAISRACAYSWRTTFCSAQSIPEAGDQLSRLIGHGIRTLNLNFSDIAASVEDWPASSRAEIIRGLILSRCPSDVLIGPLEGWLSANWRGAGYGSILRSIEQRSKREVTFPLRLPQKVYGDLAL